MNLYRKEDIFTKGRMSWFFRKDLRKKEGYAEEYL